MRSSTGWLRSGFINRTSGGGPVFRVVRNAALASIACVAACDARSGPDHAPARASASVTPVTSISFRELGGTLPGPTVALVAGVHGGKRSAVRALTELADELASALARSPIRGRVIIVPVANRAGYDAKLAQLSPLDSLNLNRVFPGRADGRPTEQVAHRIMTDIVARSDYLVDLHGSDGEEMVGAFAYAARPGLDPRVDSAALMLARHWGTPRVVWDTDGPRTLATSRFLQTAAHLSGVPAITVFESGTASEEDAAVAAFKLGARRVLAGLGVLMEETGDLLTPTMHARRDVTLAPAAGAWTPALRPNARAGAGELLGTFVDSAGTRSDLRATDSGIVLHIRRAGRVPSNSALAILAAEP